MRAFLLSSLCVIGVISKRFPVHLAYDHPEISYTSERSEEHRAHSRRLSGTTSLEEKYRDPAEADHFTELRIHYDYRFLETDAQMCRYVGQVVTPRRSEQGVSGTSYTCAAEDVYDPEWKNLMSDTADWMAGFLNLSIYKTDVNETFTIDNPLSLSWNLNSDGYNVTDTSTWSYEDTDLVIFMTLHTCQEGVAGYAQCYLEEDNRCIVGHFNWCPNQIDLNSVTDPTAIQQDRYLFLHETAHVLGCCKPDDFKHHTYAEATEQVTVFSDSGNTKTVRLVTTDLVVKTLREQTGCDTIRGVELEDVPLGAGSHFEARIMGGEVMAYGLLSSEPYLSDVTIAYLEDSGHYLGGRTYDAGCGRYGGTNNCYNYTWNFGGRFMEATATDISDSLFQSLFGGSDTFDESVVVQRSLGYLRWGRHQGCDFFEESPNTWSSRYVCTSNLEGGCTADNRMSARCYTKSWGTTTNTVSNPASCLGSQGSSCESGYNVNPNPGELPPWAKYNAHLGTCTGTDCTGGYSSSFDFVPVQLGYWNCLDAKPSSTSSMTTIGGNDTDVDTDETFGALSDELELFGGQTHGENARCFQSTLREIGSIKSLEYANYGLCYISNCYRSDYLQVGIRERGGGITWYGCPTNGGSLYLPGFTGSLTCPKAEEFCTYENISGYYYGETDLLLAWIFLGVVLGIPFLLFVWCCMCPRYSRPCVLRCKLCCGVELARDERVELAQKLAKSRVEKSNKLLHKIHRLEEKLLERGGSTVHMINPKDIKKANPKFWSEEERNWASEQVHHNKHTDKYTLAVRLANLPLAAPYRGKLFDNEIDVMRIALNLREKDPRVGGLAGAATFVLAKLTKKQENVLEYYTDIQLQKKRGRSVWFLHCINTIWIIIAMVMILMGVGTAFGFGVWDGAENAAPFLYSFGIIVLIFACMGSVGSNYLRPTLTLLCYFYVCVASVIFVVLAIIAFFLYEDWFHEKLDNEWYKLAMFFPSDYQGLSRSEAMDEFQDDTSGYGLFGFLALGIFTLLSLVSGVICSIKIMTLDSIVLNLFIGMNVFTLGMAIFTLITGIAMFKSGVLVAAPVVCILGSVILILLAIFGIYNDMHLSFRTISDHVSFHRKMFNVYFYIAFLLALLLIGGGIGVLSSKDKIKSEFDKLSDEEIGDLAEAFNQDGTRDSLKEFLVATMMFMGVIMLIDGGLMTLMLPVIRYMDHLHDVREKKLQAYEQDAEFARKEGVLKYLPADGLSIIPQFAPYRKKIRTARLKKEAAESKEQYVSVEMGNVSAPKHQLVAPPRRVTMDTTSI